MAITAKLQEASPEAKLREGFMQLASELQGIDNWPRDNIKSIRVKGASDAFSSELQAYLNDYLDLVNSIYWVNKASLHRSDGKDGHSEREVLLGRLMVGLYICGSNIYANLRDWTEEVDGGVTMGELAARRAGELVEKALNGTAMRIVTETVTRPARVLRRD